MESFLRHFQGLRTFEAKPNTVAIIKQGPAETLILYLACFNAKLDRMNDITKDGTLYLAMAKLCMHSPFGARLSNIVVTTFLNS